MQFLYNVTHPGNYQVGKKYQFVRARDAKEDACRVYSIRAIVELDMEQKGTVV